MKRIVLISLFFILFSGLNAQPFIGKSPLRRPVEYESPTYSSITTTKLSGKRGNNFWAAWADREGLVTSTNKKLSFLDKFYIVDESDTKVHIVKADGTFDLTGGIFKEEPESLGWIEKSSLILWQTALFSETTRFRLKVLTITDPSIMNKRMEEIKQGAKMLSFYNAPDSRVTNENETALFEVFYIYKKANGRVLLGKREEIRTGNAKYYILGWVNENHIQIWGQRQTLEPNYSINASGERKRGNIKTSVFANKLNAESFKKTGIAEQAFWNDDRYENRYNTYWKRFPVLSNENGVFETAVVSDLIQEDGTKVDVSVINEITQKFNEQRERSRKINVIFVIDGTQSMQPYIESVRIGVLTAVQQLRNSENDFKFGAVIYRDYNQKDDDRCYEIQNLTNHSEFYRFLSTIDTDDPACYNNTVSEGLYKGLLKTRSLLTGKEKETNLIILIGDAGDREGSNRYNESDVLPILSRYSISLLTIQSHRKSNIAYEDFIFQTKDLIIKSALQISDDQKKNYGDLNIPSLKTRPRLVQNDNGAITLFSLDQSPVSGALQYARQNESINPAIVQKEIESIIRDIDIKNDSLLNELNKLMSSVIVADPNKQGGFSSEAIQILVKAGFATDDIRVLMQRNYQFLLRGYTSLNTSNVQSDLYKFVLFLDSHELNTLKTSLDKLYIPGQTSSARRERFREAWLEILRTNYGARREEVENRTLAELTELITGLPSANDILLKYKLNEITDITILNNIEFEKICNHIKEKRDQLTRVNGDKNYYFLSNDLSYYWIPQEMLP